MTTSENPGAKSLYELEKLADELVKPYEQSDQYSLMDLLMKALESVEVFKKNFLSNDLENCQESIICYSAASKLVTSIIPSSPDFPQMSANKEQMNFYNDLVNYLLRKRSSYDKLRDTIQPQTDKSDSLLKRFQNLKTKEPVQKKQADGIDTKVNGKVNIVSLTSLRSHDFITVKQLSVALQGQSSRILVIDFRSRVSFDRSHILAPNIIQLEPLSVRDNYTCTDIEDYSMVTNSDQERRLFSHRSDFDLVVCMDADSKSGDISPGLQRLLDSLQLLAEGKPIKGNPVVLDGGFQSWTSLKMPVVASKHTATSYMPKAHQIHGQNSYDERRLIRNVSEYFSEPSAASESRSYMPIRTSTVVSPSSSLPPLPPMPRKTFHPSYQPVMSRTSSLSNSGHISSPQIPKKPTNSSVNDKGLKPGGVIMTGLVNLGNSCYMNAGLQCLMGTIKLVNFFLTGNYRRHINMNSRLGSKGLLANEFAVLLSTLYRLTNEQTPTYYNPSHFKRIIGSLNSIFANCDQQDCAEFLTYLLDSLHEDLNENGNHPPLPELSKEEEKERESLPIRIASTIEWERYLKTNFSIVVDIFEGQMMSQLRCLSCGTTSTTYNSFTILSLPIPEDAAHKEHVTLEDCFNEFVKPEILDGDDRWFCPRCKTKQRASKQLRISRLPQVLCVHLKRFRMDSYLSKIERYISYKENINLDRYWPQANSEFERNELSKLPVRGQVPPFNYRLYGVINHFGNLITGHYTAYVRKARHGWCLFEDQIVHEHCKMSEVVNGNAYILFYERV